MGGLRPIEQNCDPNRVFADVVAVFQSALDGRNSGMSMRQWAAGGNALATIEAMWQTQIEKR